MKKFLIIVAYCFFIQTVWSQNVAVEDPVLADFWCSSYPSVLNPTCDTLLVGPAQNIEGFMDLRGLGVSNASQLVEFNRIDSIDLSDNPGVLLMDSIQTSNFWSLDYINVSNNNLDSLPFLSINPNFMIVSEIIASNNRLTTFQKYWSGRDSVRILDLSDNRLTDMEDWSVAGNAVAIDLSNNFLTFEDLLPQTSHPDFSNVFTVFPQQKIQWEQSELVAEENKSFVLDLGVDHGVSGSTYTWYHNSEPIATTTSPTLTFDQLMLSDSGSYDVTITNDNPLLSGAELRSAPVILTVLPCVDITGFSYELLPQCFGGELRLDPQTIVGGEPPLTFSLASLQGEQVLDTPTSKVLTGTYTLQVTDGDGCVTVVDSNLVVNALADCDDLVITPNGDNLQDEYYFSQTGQAKIYAQNGAEVMSFSVPGYWDARNTNGELVVPGKYIMVIDEREQIELIIMW